MTYTQQPAGSGNLIATLRVLAGPAAGSELRVGGELTLGRESDGAGRLGGDPALSRRHAALTVNPSGIMTIDDLGSTNGTWVNDVRITGKQVLRAGDKIKLGETILQVGGSAGGDATRVVGSDATRVISGAPASPGPVTPPASLERARALLDANDYAGSLAEYERLITEGRDVAAACQGAGYILFLSGRLAQADALLGRSLAANPANANALYLRGQIADKQGNPAVAQDWYSQALAVNPRISRRGPR